MRTIYVVAFSLFLFSCSQRQGKSNNTAADSTTTIKDENQPLKRTFNVYKKDSISIDIEETDAIYNVYTTIGKQKKTYDLKELGVLSKWQEEVHWVNEEYAWMITWWSQSQSRGVFVPIKEGNELIYINEDIDETDSVNNNIVYVDSIYDNDKVVFKVENLLTRKNKSLRFDINEKNDVYPYYKEIILSRNKLTIKTGAEKKTIDIRDINP